MAGPRFFGRQDLSERWKIAPQNAGAWMQGTYPAGDRAADYPSFPDVSTVNGTTQIVIAAELEAWEAAVREAGLPIPGERPRGPRRQQERRD